MRFLSQTPDDIANSPGGEGWMPPDPGTVHYYNVRTGEGCSYEENNSGIYNMDSGELVRSIPWTFSDEGLGTLPGPLWLDENRFVIYRTDEGALLVSLGENFRVQRIVPTFFDIPGTAYQYMDVAWNPETETIHLLLTDFGPQHDRHDIWLYHGESGDVEALPYDHARFTRYGESLWLTNNIIIEGYEQDDNYIRPIDPPENKDVSGIHVDEIPFVQDAPDGERFAQYERLEGADAFVYIFALSGEVLDTWNVGDYEFSSLIWSPDSQYLVFVGTERSLKGEQAMNNISSNKKETIHGKKIIER